MTKNNWKKVGIIASSIIASAYLVFLASPIVINPIINNYTDVIQNEINKVSGLNTTLGGIKFVTTPKLTTGLKVKEFRLSTPKNEEILSASNFQVKMSLIPLIARNIQLDVIQLGSANVCLKFDKKGELELLQYLPTQKDDDKTQTTSSNITLPFGLKISNHMPDIRIGSYNLTLTDGVNKYLITGNKTDITDFILDKSVKINASGKAIFRDKEQFNYDIKLRNKIMPEIDLNEMITNPSNTEDSPKENKTIDVIGILDGLYNNKITANTKIDLTVEPKNIKGNLDVSNISIFDLPQSNATLNFKGEQIDINTNLYTAKNEVSTLNGHIQTGKHSNIDIDLKSKVEIANILKIIKEVALIFDIKDLQTLSANGKINADFNIKSDLKTVKSNGFLTIPNANIFYGLYNIGIDNINADISLDNNNVNIKNVGFSVLNQPLKFFGTITENASADLHLTADKLNLKGLLIALGQASLMKDNTITSGNISMNADITGKLDKINPIFKLNIANIDITNNPSNTTLKMPSSIININSDGKTFYGNAKSNNIKIINPAATLKVPEINANIKENEIEITQTPVTIEKIKTTISGKINNYLTEKITITFATSGDIKSTLTGDMNVNKQTLNLVFATTSPSTIIIPMFDKSKMTFSGNTGITGSMLNPILKGAISVPHLSIPEIPVSMTNLDAKLNGTILNGNASIQKFTSGGIIGENITSDFSMKGENFYLKNLKGSAFDGKIAGNIIYNLSSAKTSITFNGNGLNAEKAVYGAVGIKNALTGTLDFDTNLALIVADYNDMMNSLKGDLTFSVKNGAFGSIGRLENLLQANNLITNSILKTTVSTISKGAGLAETANFDSIDGKLKFENGWVDLIPIKSSAPLLTYYITGKYNLTNGKAILNILGRLDGKIVAKLGPLGELSANKILSYIPKFGTSTANFVNSLTSNPDTERIDLIPALSSGGTTYKDFKVVMNGTLGNASAIKSFKWLTQVDTSAIENKTIKETFKDIKTSVNEDLTNTVKNVTDAVSNSKEQWNTTREQFKNSASELKNLFKKQTTVTEEEATTTTVTETIEP